MTVEELIALLRVEGEAAEAAVLAQVLAEAGGLAFEIERLVALLPDEPFSAAITYRETIRPIIEEEAERHGEAFLAALLLVLMAREGRFRAALVRYRPARPGAPGLRNQDQLARTVRVLNIPLAQLFTRTRPGGGGGGGGGGAPGLGPLLAGPGGPGGPGPARPGGPGPGPGRPGPGRPRPGSPAPFTRQVLQFVDRALAAGWALGENAAQLASRIVTRVGPLQFPNLRARGTVLNQLRARERAITSAAVWSTVNTTVTRTWEGSVNGMVWRFFTAQDELVCARCRPLHGRTWVRRADAEIPPLHPQCRCDLLLVGGAAPNRPGSS